MVVKGSGQARQQLEDDTGSRKGLLRTGYGTLSSYAEINIPETEKLTPGDRREEHCQGEVLNLAAGWRLRGQRTRKAGLSSFMKRTERLVVWIHLRLVALLGGNGSSSLLIVFISSVTQDYELQVREKSVETSKDRK